MALNMSKMRKEHEKAMKKGDFWGVPEGDTLVYIHPPCKDKDKFPLTQGLNFIPIEVHYGLGDSGGQMAVCLDTSRNEILNHPSVKKALKKRGVKLSGECSACNAIEEGKMSSSKAQRSRVQTKWLWGLTPLKFRDKPSGKYQKLELIPSPSVLSKTVFDGLMDVFDQLDDITDPDSATFVNINRRGKSMTNTKYKVNADAKTTREPISLPKKMRKLIQEALKESGTCDLFNIVSNMIKGEDELEALILGVKTEEDSDEDERDVDEDEFDDEEEDDEEILDDEEDEDELDEEDDDDEEDDEEDDDEEDDEEDDDEEEDDDLEEEEEEKPKKTKKKSKKEKVKKKSKKTEKKIKKEKVKKKSKKTKDTEDSDDLDLDELDAELDAMSKKKKKKTKK